MNRDEFCKLMAAVRSKSKITTTELSFQIKMLLPTLRRFEKGEHNFKLDRVIQYLSILGYQIILYSKNETDCVFKIIQYSDIPKFIKCARKDKYTQRELATNIGCTRATIANIERQSNIVSIDMFLKLVETLNYNVKIEKI